MFRSSHLSLSEFLGSILGPTNFGVVNICRAHMFLHINWSFYPFQFIEGILVILGF